MSLVYNTLHFWVGTSAFPIRPRGVRQKGLLDLHCAILESFNEMFFGVIRLMVVYKLLNKCREGIVPRLSEERYLQCFPKASVGASHVQILPKIDGVNVATRDEPFVLVPSTGDPYEWLGSVSASINLPSKRTIKRPRTSWRYRKRIISQRKERLYYILNAADGLGPHFENVII